MDLVLARKIDMVRRRKERGKVLSRKVLKRRELEFKKFKERINF